MNITEQIEEKLGIKIETLNAAEKETYFSMLTAVQKSQMTPEKLKEYISSMKDAVEKELINEPEFIRIFIFKVENRKQILLKARLQNYRLLESFLLSPEKAKEALEEMISNIGGK
jgi:hypothetical protein